MKRRTASHSGTEWWALKKVHSERLPREQPGPISFSLNTLTRVEPTIVQVLVPCRDVVKSMPTASAVTPMQVWDSNFLPGKQGLSALGNQFCQV